jgi:hypothetical protein
MRSFKDISVQAKNTTKLALELAAQEATSWDVFRWVVFALLALNIILTLFLFGSARSEIAALKLEREDYKTEIAELRAQVDEQISRAKAQLSGDIAAAQSGLMRELRKASTMAVPQQTAPAVPLPLRAPVSPR